MYSLHLTHPKWTHTRSSGQPCYSARGAVGGPVSCSRTPQSWYWRRILPPPTIPAGPEIRTHNLLLTSPTRYPLGHDCPNRWTTDVTVCLLCFIFISEKWKLDMKTSVSQKTNQWMHLYNAFLNDSHNVLKDFISAACEPLLNEFLVEQSVVFLIEWCLRY